VPRDGTRPGADLENPRRTFGVAIRFHEGDRQRPRTGGDGSDAAWILKRATQEMPRVRNAQAWIPRFHRQRPPTTSRYAPDTAPWSGVTGPAHDSRWAPAKLVRHQSRVLGGMGKQQLARAQRRLHGQTSLLTAPGDQRPSRPRHPMPSRPDTLSCSQGTTSDRTRTDRDRPAR
jgi:hypothetical protein